MAYYAIPSMPSRKKSRVRITSQQVQQHLKQQQQQQTQFNYQPQQQQQQPPSHVPRAFVQSYAQLPQHSFEQPATHAHPAVSAPSPSSADDFLRPQQPPAPVPGPPPGTIQDLLMHLKPVMSQRPEDMPAPRDARTRQAVLEACASAHQSMAALMKTANPTLGTYMSANRNQLLSLASWTTSNYWFRRFVVRNLTDPPPTLSLIELAQLEWAEASLVQLCAISVGYTSPLAMDALSWDECVELVMSGQWGVCVSRALAAISENLTLQSVLTYNRSIKSIPDVIPNAFITGPVVNYRMLCECYQKADMRQLPQSVTLDCNQSHSATDGRALVLTPDLDAFAADQL